MKLLVRGESGLMGGERVKTMIREEPKRLGVWGGQAGGCGRGSGSGSNASGADVFYAGRQTFWQTDEYFFPRLQL